MGTEYETFLEEIELTEADVDFIGQLAKRFGNDILYRWSNDPETHVRFQEDPNWTKEILMEAAIKDIETWSKSQEDLWEQISE